MLGFEMFNNSNMPKYLLSILLLITPIYTYLQLPLTFTHNEAWEAYTIQIQVLKSKYNLALSLDKQIQYLNPPHNSKIPKKNTELVGHLDGHSIEQNHNVEGWRRYFIEAFLFVESRYNHRFTLDLDWMEIKRNSSSLTNGVVSLSPSIINSRFFNQIKRHYPHITSDEFGIYMGNSKNSIQLGGYEPKYAYQTVVGQLHRAQLLDSDDSWVISAHRLAFTKDDNGKYADYIVSQEPIGLKLSLSHNRLTLKPQVIDTLLIALQSQHITCKFSPNLQCSNMTSLDMSLHQFVFPITLDFSINISMYRLLDQCDKKLQVCRFHVQTGGHYQIGTSLFKDHYTVFNMEEKWVMVGLSNKYPSEWFSTVYVIRVLVVLFVVMIITACVIDTPQYFKFLKHRREDVEGVELVSHQELHEF